eukprot:TRINITY_DN2467_c2_g1_i1.p1 TRINITY_DN2467_c2_g1~~TRINITY_DN2467_c2_g1_i1.p1  ORF type:complete len:448 (+),score=98.79 TRINITY_DN2467_c2_g1_i1:163-1506(+)
MCSVMSQFPELCSQPGVSPPRGGAMAFHELQSELELERQAHRATEDMYNKALRDIDDLNKELLRVNTVWGEEVKREAAELRECRVDVEVLLREKETNELTIRDLEERLQEADSDLTETHKRLTEAVVTATSAASKIDTSEQAISRLRDLVAQLEDDVSRVRHVKDNEIESYQLDLEAMKVECSSLADRLRESESARLDQSKYIEEVARLEIEIQGYKRTHIQRRITPSPVPARGDSPQAHVATAHASTQTSPQVRTPCGAHTPLQPPSHPPPRRPKEVPDDPLEGEIRLLRQRTQQLTAQTTTQQQHKAGYAGDEPDMFARLSVMAKECIAAVDGLTHQQGVLSQRLASVTGCIIDMSRSDTQILEFIDGLRGEMQNLGELEEDNARIMRLVHQATDQMAHFSEAVSKAEAEELAAADKEFDSLCARIDGFQSNPVRRTSSSRRVSA